MPPLDTFALATPPERRRVGRSRRAAYHVPRQRKLSPEQEAAIPSSAGTRTLREPSAEFGVSQETVRSVLRAPPPVETAA